MRRTITKTLAKTFAAAAVAAGLLVAPPATQTASAQEIQLTGPLAGAPAVRKMREYRVGRFEVAPTASITLLDEYRRTICFGGRLQYNVFDWLGVGAWGCYGAVSITTDLTDQVDSRAPRNARTAVNVNHTGTPPNLGNAPFDAQVAKPEVIAAAPQVQFAPFRGKLAIFQKIFVDTDLYAHLGLGIVSLKERQQCGGTGQKPCTDPTTFALDSRVAFSPTFGLGLNFYIGSLVSINFEYRAMPYSWNRGGFDQRGAGNNAKFPDNKVDSQDQTFKFNQLLTLGVGFAFPKAKVSE
jgi:outer membrane beta-barrel protein